MCLVAHLQASSSQSVQHFDVPSGKWVTLLRNSPAIRITVNSTHHFKNSETEVPIQSLLSSISSLSSCHIVNPFDGPLSALGQTSPRKSHSNGKMKVFGSASDVVDLSSECDEHVSVGAKTPCPSPRKVGRHVKSPEVGFVGRPSSSSEFPIVSAVEMDIRMRWIDMTEGDGSLQRRFSAVFTCEYKPSTFHKHWAAWRWLHFNGYLRNLNKDDLWKSLLELAPGVRKQTNVGIGTKVESEPVVLYID